MSSYIPIASQTLTSAASSVTFSSIPTTLGGKALRDLILVVDWLGSGGNSNAGLRFNGDTSTNYPFVFMRGTGSSSSSSFSSSATAILGGHVATTTRRALTVFQIMDYAQTNKHKAVLLRGHRADGQVEAVAGKWINTAATNQLTIVTTSNSYAAGSTFSLYGIQG
jgi:hypothetical protein